MTVYASFSYIFAFLPLAMLLYSLTPQRYRRYMLLLISYGVFWSISGKLLVYLLVATVSVHYFGLWLDSLLKQRAQALAEAEKAEKKAIKARYQKKMTGVVAVGVLAQLLVLLVLKYSGFFGENINHLLTLLGLPFQLEIPAYLLPIGISFYTMQAMAYLFDVYRGTVRADASLGRLALFMAFFPQLMEGPICRYNDTALALWDCKPLVGSNMSRGLLRAMYGLMKKLVVADRMNSMLDFLFYRYKDFDGGVVLLAAVCYTVQLYMDFSGTLDVVVGTGEIFGIRYPENFRQPFFSKSISDFWTRWHITLGTWFRDYIFYPMSMSKPLKKLTVKARKRLGNHFGPLLAGSIALFSVWICNGLWHGADWKYIFFGLYHFALILMGNIFAPLISKGAERLHIDRSSKPYHAFQIVRTCILVVIGELFFRAQTMQDGLAMFKLLVTGFSFDYLLHGDLTRFKMDVYDVGIVLVACALVLLVDILHEKGISVRDTLARQPLVIRWCAYYALIFFVIIFGAYGLGYVPLDPIYANF